MERRVMHTCVRPPPRGVGAARGSALLVEGRPEEPVEAAGVDGVPHGDELVLPRSTGALRKHIPRLLHPTPRLVLLA